MKTIDSFQGPYRFLSNFWSVQITYEKLSYPTVEHAYQAAKTLDQADRYHIAVEDTPGRAKRAGQKLTLRDDWEEIKLDVMEQLLRLKFAEGSKLLTWLRNTQDAELIEGNTWGDKFWGVCNGEGQNHLGKLLMKIRDE